MKIDFDELYENLPTIPIKLTHSRKKAKRIVQKMCGGDEAVNWDALTGSDAKTSILENPKTGETVYLVWMTPYLDYSAAQDAAMLAHEATHVAMGYFEYIGEETPSEEFMAYTIQTITQYLVEKHFAWKKRKLNDSR